MPIFLPKKLPHEGAVSVHHDEALEKSPRHERVAAAVEINVSAIHTLVSKVL